MAGGGRVASVETGTGAAAQVRKFPLSTLVAIVVGSMAGAGRVLAAARFHPLRRGARRAYLAWTLMGAEVLYVPANDRDMLSPPS